MEGGAGDTAVPSQPLCRTLACLVLLVACPVRGAGLKVEVEGLPAEQRRNVLAFLSIDRERENPSLQEGRLRRLHERAPEEIRRALTPFGLFRVDVQGELSEAQGVWVARYRVEPGEVIPVGSVDVQVSGEGASEVSFPAAGLAAGQPYSQSAYDAAKSGLRRVAQDRGYLDAHYTRSEILVGLDPYRADVTLHLETGRRYYFGDVHLEQEGFDPEFLHRFVDFQPGDPYAFGSLIGLQRALLDTEYFREVEVAPQLERVEGQRVPIDVTLERNKPNRYRFGVGYGTDTGPRVSADWTRRYIGERGHSAHTLLSLSPVLQRAEASYRIPLAEPRREFLSFDSVVERYDTVSREGLDLGVGVSHHLFWGHWQRILGVSYDFEVPEGGGEENFHSLVPSATWVWKVADDPIDTRRGTRVDMTVQGASEYALSSGSFLQGKVRAKAVRSPSDRVRLITRAELGGTLAGSVEDIPPSRRFYAGGDNSVRGYKFEKLSPRDGDGDRRGGKYLLTASVELEHAVAEKWAVAGFYDTGNAFDSFRDLEMEQGAGVGVRWLSPVGMVRLDVARPVAGGDGGVQFYISVGPDL